MYALVITGGIGAGKSTAARFFRDKGAVVIGLDDVAARVLAPGSAALGAVASEFGVDVLLADGRLDRAALARAAFASQEAAGRLNDLVHPATARELERELDTLRASADPPALVVIEVPLLAEAPAIATFADAVLAIVAPQETRVARAVANGLPERDVRRRVAVQATDAERASLADAVIINDGTAGDFARQLEGFFREHVALGAQR
jgi:dephospho-CoA kinase